MGVSKKLLALTILVGTAVAAYGVCTAPGSNKTRETKSDTSTFFPYANCFDHLTPDHFTQPDDKQAIITATYRWPMGVIPYTLDDSVGPSDLTAITGGMKLITDSTCLTFKAKEITDLNYVKIQTKNLGCYSTGIGMRGRGEQIVNLHTSGCTHTYSAAHELLHAAGLYHEHARSDRDKYITVDYQNCCTEKVFNYQRCNDTKTATESCDNYGFAYNVKSIMHYPGIVTDATIAVNTSKAIMVSKDPNNPIPNRQNDKLTEEDIAIINYIYNNCSLIPT